jgi:hypothetical protein
LVGKGCLEDPGLLGADFHISLVRLQGKGEREDPELSRAGWKPTGNKPNTDRKPQDTNQKPTRNQPESNQKAIRKQSETNQKPTTNGAQPERKH